VKSSLNDSFSARDQIFMHRVGILSAYDQNKSNGPTRTSA